MQKILSFILLFSFYINPLQANISIKPLDLATSHYAIGRSVLVYEDKDANMTLYDIRRLSSNDFVPLNKPVSSRLFTNSALWYLFTVINNEKDPVNRLIIFEPAWLDTINITIVSENGQIQNYRSGNIYPYARRVIDHYFINFNHDFEPGLSTVYVQVRTRDPFIVSISLMKIPTFLADQIGASFWIGLIYGGIIAMLFYNIFLFFGIKERYYAFYVLYLCTFFMMNAAYNGYTFMYFFSNYPNVQNWAQSISIFFFVFASLLFAQSFLNLKKYHFTLYAVTTYFIYFILGISLLSAAIGGYRYHVIFAILSIMLTSIYIFGIALFSWLKGNRSARFFLLGAASGLIGSFITALTVMSFIPYSYMTYKATDFGMYIDAVLLSMALADRMKITQEKKLIAEKEAKTDILTGLFNRRAYDKISHAEYQRLVRLDRGLSVIMFDIDDFKTVNDTYGHNAGDIMLKTVASIVKRVMREYDYAFRMGGDEFLLLLPETKETEAYQLAERLRTELKDQKIKVNGDKHSITASFGISQFVPTDESIENVAKRADKALYQAKKSGKDRVVILNSRVEGE